MKNEEITIDKLEGWVRNQFKNLTLPRHKYPVCYGTYDLDREAQHERKAQFYESYWADPAADLQIYKQELSSQLDKQRKQIYIEAWWAIDRAQKELSKTDYYTFKNEIIYWILARTNKHGFGIKKLDKATFPGVDLSSELCNELYKLNLARLNWIDSYEKLQVVNDSLRAKAKKSELSYIPLDIKTEKGENGGEDSYLETRWESKEKIMLSPIEKIKLVERIRKRDGVKNYPEAIKIAAKESGQYIYANYNSFKTQRNELKEYL